MARMAPSRLQQRHKVPGAASRSGQPRPISLLGRAGRLYRAWSRHGASPSPSTRMLAQTTSSFLRRKRVARSSASWLLSASRHAPGCPKLQQASANQPPVGPHWRAISGLVSTWPRTGSSASRAPAIRARLRLRIRAGVRLGTGLGTGLGRGSGPESGSGSVVRVSGQGRGWGQGWR